MLEASGFDFRNRSPQNLLVKLAKHYNVDRETVGKTAYNMSLDLYRTFGPLKQTTPTMAIACVELSARVHDWALEEFQDGQTYKKWRTTRPQVMGNPCTPRCSVEADSLPETMLDLLDLYTHHRGSTIVGLQHPVESFINLRIVLNQEASAHNYPRFTAGPANKTEPNGLKATNGGSDKKHIQSPVDDPIKSIRSPQEIVSTNGTGTPTQGKPGLRDGTVRFMLDAERAREERHAVSEFFKAEMEEYEVEIERERKRV